MAKLSLWLLTLARNKPFTFLDHAIKRITVLEKVRINGKPKKSAKKTENFQLPGCSESIVMGALLDKVQNQRKMKKSEWTDYLID